jgi:hypothetical protein
MTRKTKDPDMAMDKAEMKKAKAKKKKKPMKRASGKSE